MKELSESVKCTKISSFSKKNYRWGEAQGTPLRPPGAWASFALLPPDICKLRGGPFPYVSLLDPQMSSYTPGSSYCSYWCFTNCKQVIDWVLLCAISPCMRYSILIEDPVSTRNFIPEILSMTQGKLEKLNLLRPLASPVHYTQTLHDTNTSSQNAMYQNFTILKMNNTHVTEK